MAVSENKCTHTRVWMLIQSFNDEYPSIWLIPADKFHENTKKNLLEHKETTITDLLYEVDCSTGELVEIGNHSLKDNILAKNYDYLHENSIIEKIPIIVEEIIRF